MTSPKSQDVQYQLRSLRLRRAEVCAAIRCLERVAQIREARNSSDSQRLRALASESDSVISGIQLLVA